MRAEASEEESMMSQRVNKSRWWSKIASQLNEPRHERREGKSKIRRERQGKLIISWLFRKTHKRKEKKGGERGNSIADSLAINSMSIIGV